MLAVGKDGVLLDSLSVVPGSVRISGVPDSDFVILPQRSLLTWKRRPQRDSVAITYRVFPLDLGHTYFHKSRKLADSSYVFSYHPSLAKGSGSAGFVDYNELEYTGSYGRSISLGNNQDVALNSHFNLQANGYLLDSIKLEAAISDNTIPFQPEGNTQSISQFDQIYIRLQKGHTSLQLGDYNLDKPKGYFLNYYKRVQGLYFQTATALNKHTTNAVGLSGSIAKGEFARNIFQGLEGNQGPYKLTGNNGEQYFIVLAATEKVYINGLLQERGENADYTINYNTGEIRFMPRRLITKDSRIQVEFEYRSQYYLNSLLYAYDELQAGKHWNIRLNAYSNQDAKNQGYQQSLTGDQKNFLSTIGDSIQNAYSPVITLDTFAAGKILYKIKDSTVAGVRYDSVLVYTANADSAEYSVSFSYVGEGKGDYVISATDANGRVYNWVPRINGAHQGDYAPVQLLVTPKRQQVFTLNTTYTIDSQKVLNVEVAASNTAPNLFSNINNNTHWGAATRLHYTEVRPLGAKDTSGHHPWTLTNDASYEFVQDRFRAIAPYRDVEFGRNWNVPQTDNNKPNEQLAGFTTKLENRNLGLLSYAFGYYHRGAFYDGERNVVSYALDKKLLHLGWSLNLLDATDTFQRSVYFRPTAFVEYRIQRLLNSIAGLKYEAEHNRITDKQTDTLRPTAFSFDIASAYLKTTDNKKTAYSLTYTLRRDQSPRGDAFHPQSHSSTVDYRVALTKWKNHLVTITGSYRDLVIDDTTFNTQTAGKTLLGRLEYTGTWLRRVVQWQTLYEIGSGQEQKRDYTYVEVPAGQGIYNWIDYNNDGVQQSNEFVVAVYDDQKKFIRVLTPTNEYVPIHYVNYNQTIALEPARYWNSKKMTATQHFLSRFSDQAALQISNRLLAGQGVTAYNPFASTLRDSNIIITSNSLSNTLYYNRTSSGWGIDYSYLHNSGKQLLTYGVEGNATTTNTVRLRWNLNPSFTFNLTGGENLRGYQSALADGRTYSVRGYNTAPSLTWLYRSVFRITGALQYDDRHNEAAYGGEHATIAGANIELRYSKPTYGVILLRTAFSQIGYNGLSTSPVTYTILDALQPGNNYTWNANWERRVSKGVELSLEYEGRKPGTGGVVHTGRMTVRAIL